MQGQRVPAFTKLINMAKLLFMEVIPLYSPSALDRSLSPHPHANTAR